MIELGIRDLQSKELDLAKKFVEICKKNNLRYFIIGGTFLGAIRHEGFIPWDDDMDFGMPRKDYEEFLKLSINDCNIEIQHYSLSDEFKYSFIKIVDHSIQVEIRNGVEVQVVPAWIDIFPLDNVPKNSFKKYFLISKLLYRRMMISFKNIDRIDTNKENRPIHEKILLKFGSLFNPTKKQKISSLYEKLDSALKKYDEEQGAYWINIMGSYKAKEIFPIEVFAQGENYKFEDTYFVGPAEYDEYLNTLYGDYMVLPNEEDRNHHNSNIINK